MPITSLLSELMSDDLTSGAIDDVDAWWTVHSSIAARHSAPADLALAAGFASDRAGWAFASGYQAALRSLVPSLARDHRVAFAVTESAGNHPRNIETTLVDGRLDGVKSFVTLGTHADTILVVATRGLGEDGRPRLVVVLVPAHAAGVVLEELPVASFVCEVPHARATFTEVTIPEGELAPGDGYADYVLPFRTVEDAHVHLALVGFFLRVARTFGASAKLVAELLLLAKTAHALSGADPKDPMTHILLAGALSHVSNLAGDERLWKVADEATRSLWKRDISILQVAERARQARLERALLTFGR
jgi:acyl-CoA dehydrogenase